MDKRALVLGGGGVTGAGWELGLVAGLVAEGIDLAAADLIAGTSAGAVTGAQLSSGADLESL
jgi:NTE family protein